jgi:TPR repeat protein
MPSPYEESAKFYRYAAVAGIAGGLAMAIVAFALSATRGVDPWVPLKMPSAAFYLQRAMEPGFDAAPVAIGLLVHLGVSMVWATMFGYVAYGLSGVVTMLVGPIWGLVAGAATAFVALPLLGLTRLRADMPLGPAVIEHLTLGLCFGLVFGLPKLAFRQHRVQPAGA